MVFLLPTLAVLSGSAVLDFLARSSTFGLLAPVGVWASRYKSALEATSSSVWQSRSLRNTDKRLEQLCRNCSTSTLSRRASNVRSTPAISIHRSKYPASRAANCFLVSPSSGFASRNLSR
uniref:Putative secreted protein n=1 Tax=Ixodes ricinus TaxID=34613 RepID=A0A6B0UNI7_IXORI